MLIMFILDCVAEQQLFKTPLSRKIIKKPREVKKVLLRMPKKWQNEVKRTKFLFNEVKNKNRSVCWIPAINERKHKLHKKNCQSRIFFKTSGLIKINYESIRKSLITEYHTKSEKKTSLNVSIR